ncbi:MAG: GNAT family N-acetyltransferase [Faecousia sp.]
MLELARPADREAVNALAREVHAMHVQWRPDKFEMAEELYPEERFQEAVENRELYVARLGGMIAGYVLLRVRSVDFPGQVKKKVMLVEEICVEEALRNQGIGKQIMWEVRALARAFGCRDLQLSVYPQNESAVAFYEKCGFTIQHITLHSKV